MMKRVTTVVLICAFVVVSPLAAASKSASLTVSVEVIARTIMTVDTQPASVDVTANDVARGYVELPNSVLFHVRSNATNGYVIQFQPVNGPFSRADVTLGSAQAAVGTDGAWLSQPYQRGTTSGSFSVRLMIAPGTQPGSYAWPVRFDAGSL
jgi:hypothetical protein